MQKQQLRKEDADAGMSSASGRRADVPTDAAAGGTGAGEALPADVQVAVEQMLIWQWARSFGPTATVPASRWFLGLYLINSQTRYVLF